MKKYLKLLMIPLLLLPLFTNVYAEGDNTETGGETTAAWPKSFQITEENVLSELQKNFVYNATDAHYKYFYNYLLRYNKSAS